MLSKRLGIHYKDYKLIINKKEQNKEFGELCLFIPLFMRNLWENPESLATILSNLKKDDSKNIANLIAHNFYNNIFSSNHNEEQLIYLITLLLKEEIKKLKSEEINVSQFLNGTSIEFILKEFKQKKDVLSFFKENLAEIIKFIEMETPQNPLCFASDKIVELTHKLSNNKGNNKDNSNISNKVELGQNKDNANKKRHLFHDNYLAPLNIDDLKNKLQKC